MNQTQNILNLSQNEIFFQKSMSVFVHSLFILLTYEIWF